MKNLFDKPDCYDCIHCGACSDAGDAGFSCLKEDASKCKHFKNKEDFVKVKHGEWMLMGTEMFMDGSYSSKFCCSLCSREIGVCHEHDSDKYRYAKVMYPYCHCGAIMDGGDKS